MSVIGAGRRSTAHSLSVNVPLLALRPRHRRRRSEIAATRQQVAASTFSAPTPEERGRDPSDRFGSASTKIDSFGTAVGSYHPKVWQATNTEARDFRLETLGPQYSSTLLSAESDGTYAGRVETPSAGWTAYVVELTFDVGLAVPLKLTTEVVVTPNTLPFADRDWSQPITITFKCETESEATAAKLMSDAQQAT